MPQSSNAFTLKLHLKPVQRKKLDEFLEEINFSLSAFWEFTINFNRWVASCPYKPAIKQGDDVSIFGGQFYEVERHTSDFLTSPYTTRVEAVYDANGQDVVSLRIADVKLKLHFNYLMELSDFNQRQHLFVFLMSSGYQILKVAVAEGCESGVYDDKNQTFIPYPLPVGANAHLMTV